MKRLRRSLRGQWSDHSKLMGLFFGLAALCLLLPGIFSPNRLGTVDNGRYESTMLSAGLEYLDADAEEADTLFYHHVIERYGYGSFSYWKLLAPNGENSIVYPIALIRVVTAPFGLDFSTQYLALLYALLFALGVYMLVRATGCVGGWLAAIPGFLLLLAAGSRNLTAYFNSLYPIATVTVSLVLMLGTAMRLFTYGRKRVWRSLAAFLAAGAFCLNSSVISLIFAPFVLIVTAATFVMAYGKRELHLRCAVCAILAVLAMVSSSAQYRRESADVQSHASVYHAAFLGFLEASDDPAADLAEFGLDESYVADVGKSYYGQEEDYAHCPRDESEAVVLFQKLTADSVGSWYLRHPLRLLKTANRQTEAFNHFESDVVLRVGQTTADTDRVSRNWSIADTLMKMLLPTDYSGVTCLFVIELCAAVWIAVRLWKRRGAIFSVLAAGAFVAFAVGCFGYLLCYLRYMGREFLACARIVCVFGMLPGIGGICVAAGDAIGVLSVWFRAKQERHPLGHDLSDWNSILPRRGCALRLRGNFGARICGNRTRGVLCVLVLALGMSAIVQFSPVRAGCVNNGDFGRMMEQLGLIWEGDIYYNVGAQLGRRVIETYAYRDSFDWMSLTFLDPKYSLVYPAALVRLICNLTGQPFSTWYLSMVMNAVMILCIVSIVNDLYDLMGRYAVLLGTVLCGVFLCESYLVWFNSLYGESCMFMGLFMVIACAVHLAVRPANTAWSTVLLLLFSGRILVCAKAQMLVTLPFVVLLIVVFALYQRPLALRKLIPYTLVVMIGCALICMEGITVYNDNSGISERQTVWQSTFYGALMISDDPQATMEELGIDTSMMPDIGKDAYHSDDDYVISPNSPEADAALYDHVNTFTMVKYYLRHPVQLLKMLNHAAQSSRTLYNDFRAYQGQDYSESHDEVQRFGLWQYWRSFFTCGSFAGYVVLYGAAVAVCIFGILRRKQTDIRVKMLTVVYLGVMFIGAVQYPLSVIGNGFADNHKQMFGFMMCHDFLVLFSICAGLCFLKAHGRELAAKRYSIFHKR